MILTEHGLHFAKDGDHWRCVEHPDLLMLRGDCYQLIDATLATGSFSLKGSRFLTYCGAVRQQLVQHGYVSV
jgi:hypothetical protein